MIAIEVTINDEPAFVAGIEHLSAVSAILTTALRDAKDGLGAQRETTFHVDGLHAETEERRSWVRRELTLGDRITMQIVNVPHASEPVSIEKVDPDFLEKQRRRHYEALKRKYEPGT